MIERLKAYCQIASDVFLPLGFRTENESHYGLSFHRKDGWEIGIFLETYDPEPTISISAPDHKKYVMPFLAYVFQEIDRKPYEVSNFLQSCNFIKENNARIFEIPQSYREIYDEKHVLDPNYPEISKTIWPYTATIKSKW